MALGLSLFALKNWAEQRVRSIFHHEFQETGVRVEVPSFGEDFTRAGWLKTNAALIAFQTEVAKYIYYRFKY